MNGQNLSNQIDQNSKQITMTPQQALSILDEATSMIRLNRAEHLQVSSALIVLDGFIKLAQEKIQAQEKSK